MMRSALVVAAVLAVSTTLSSASAAPANDDFDAATDIGPGPAVTTVSFSGATLEQDESVWCLRAHDDLDASVWYRYVAPRTERITIRTVQSTSTFGHLLSVLVGEGLQALRPVACRERDTSTLGAGVEVFATAGTAYMIQLAARSTAPGNMRLAVGFSSAGDITGRVTRTDGAPVEQICVSTSSATSSVVGTTETGPDGTYILSAPAGSYVVQFRDCRRLGYTRTSVGGDDFSTLGTVVVQPHQRTEGVDATLRRFGSIEGRVTASDGTPAQFVCVYTLSRDGSLSEWPVSTDADGRYVVGDLLPDGYRMKFIDCREDARYVSEWYDDQPTWHTASPVTLAEGDAIAGIDAQLAPVAG